MLHNRKKLPYSNKYYFKGATLNYEVRGKGPKIILLHGSMLANPWFGFEKILSNHFTVYMPHMPGFGGSDSVKGELHTPDLFSEAFAEFIRSLKLERIPIVTLSMGTIIALKTAVKGTALGTLILVGLPMSFSGVKFKISKNIPVAVRRLMVRTYLGKKLLLVPILRDNTGPASKERDKWLIHNLNQTSPEALVDIDVLNEMNDLKDIIQKTQNEKIYVFGSADKLLKHFYIEGIKPVIIQGAEHNIFRTHPKETLLLIRNSCRT